ncbi:hypothetical protein FMA36_16165 [Komagataeibacter xylinus]|uniref:Uncharacterized protein n=1 Tax=Komagataeibacter xylinus TaxID=28448 RepID=A0A857FTH3_KOMXY|nr:hypothetical protein FMA36_16165 [Komagataeibacter xylinus]
MSVASNTSSRDVIATGKVCENAHAHVKSSENYAVLSLPFASYVHPAVHFRQQKTRLMRAGLSCPIKDLFMVAGNRILRSRRNMANGHSQASLVAGAGLLLSLRQPQVESKAGLIGCFNELFSAHA